MKIAKNTKNWVITPFLISIIFIIFFFIIDNNLFKSIFIFLFYILMIIAFFMLVFFRDPERKIGSSIVSPADGKIREIVKIDDKELGGTFKISIFMNIYNVHVNRMPIDGKIMGINHKPGGYIPAYKKESERNERMVLDINTIIGNIKMILIAGTIARRIILYKKKGDYVKKGIRIGIIRLGSRVDLYLPEQKISKINVELGDMVLAGETTIAEITN